MVATAPLFYGAQPNLGLYSGSAGDADFYAALKAVAELKRIAPKMAVELGASGEFVLGMHGEVEFAGQRLAGMYPHQQVKMADADGRLFL